MKTLILYATKHGAAREVAQRIAASNGNATVADLKQGGATAVDLSAFDCVIIGSSVYAGLARKEAKAFAAQYVDVLLTKRVGLFISCMDTNGERGVDYFTSNFPPKLVSAAKAKLLAGGIFDPSRAGAFERFLYKMVAKQSSYLNTIDDKKIEQFVQTMGG